RTSASDAQARPRRLVYSSGVEATFSTAMRCAFVRGRCPRSRAQEVARDKGKRSPSPRFPTREGRGSRPVLVALVAERHLCTRRRNHLRLRRSAKRTRTSKSAEGAKVVTAVERKP